MVLAIEVLAGLAVLVGIALVASSGAPTLEDEPTDSLEPALPYDRSVSAEDVARLRFRVAIRGYRMSDVDEAMQRIGESMAVLEQERDRAMRSAPSPPPPAPSWPTASAPPPAIPPERWGGVRAPHPPDPPHPPVDPLDPFTPPQP